MYNQSTDALMLASSVALFSWVIIMFLIAIVLDLKDEISRLKSKKNLNQ